MINHIYIYMISYAYVYVCMYICTYEWITDIFYFKDILLWCSHHNHNFLEGFRFLTLSWKLGSIPTPTDPVWQFVKMVHNLHLMLVLAKVMFPEIFQTQLSSFNDMIYLFTPYFSATPPCIVANTGLWLATLYSWRNWDTLFLEI